MRMTGASSSDVREASRTSVFISERTSSSDSSPFMMDSIARAGLLASRAAFRRAKASEICFSGATHGQMCPPAARVTSSCAGRLKGSAKAIVSRPPSFAIGTALTLIQKSSVLPQRRSWLTVKLSGSANGAMLKYAASASVNAAGSTRSFCTRNCSSGVFASVACRATSLSCSASSTLQANRASEKLPKCVFVCAAFLIGFKSIYNILA